MRYVVLDMPLESIHPAAFKAAETTHCAEEQGKFWEMHDRLFNHQRNLEPWTAHATALSLDVEKFETCLNSGQYAAAIRKDMAEGQKAGVRGTPSFVLARTDPENASKVKGLIFIRGAQGFNQFKAQIDKALTE